MPEKQPECKYCGHKLKKVDKGNGWGHKKKEHWMARPHKAVPVVEAVSAS